MALRRDKHSWSEAQASERDCLPMNTAISVLDTPAFVYKWMCFDMPPLCLSSVNRSLYSLLLKADYRLVHHPAQTPEPAP